MCVCDLPCTAGQNNLVIVLLKDFLQKCQTCFLNSNLEKYQPALFCLTVCGVYKWVTDVFGNVNLCAVGFKVKKKTFFVVFLFSLFPGIILF